MITYDFIQQNDHTNLCDRSSAFHFRYLTCLLDRGHITYHRRPLPSVLFLFFQLPNQISPHHFGKSVYIVDIGKILPEDFLLRRKILLLPCKYPQDTHTLIPQSPHLKARIRNGVFSLVRLRVSGIWTV